MMTLSLSSRRSRRERRPFPAMEAQAQCQALRAVAAALQDNSLRAAGGREILEGAEQYGRRLDRKRHLQCDALRPLEGGFAGRTFTELPWKPYSLEDDPRNVFSTVYRETLLG